LRNSRNRRQFLAIASGLLAVPLLQLKHTRAQSTGNAPLRFLTILDSYGISPNGRNQTWIDSTVGDYALTADSLGSILAPFAPHRDNLIVMSNINNESSMQTRDGITHDKLTSQALTGSRTINSVVGAAANQHHESIDVLIGNYLHNDYGLQFPRVYPHLFLSDYAEATKTSFCFDGAGNQIRAISGPSNVVASLFGGGTGDQESQALDAQSQNLALALVRERLNTLRPQLINANAAEVMDAYEDSVQDLATELELRAGRTCAAPSVGAGGRNMASPPMMMDAIYQALACDMASSISYSIGGEQISQIVHRGLYDAAVHNDSDVQATLNLNYHAISHRVTPAADKAHEIVRAWELSLVADLIDRLATTPDVDGSMVLDNTVIFMHSAMSHNTHNRTNFALAAYAGANTNLKGGFHYDCSGHTNNELMVTLAQGVTTPISEFGGYNQAGNRLSALNNGPISKMLKEVIS